MLYNKYYHNSDIWSLGVILYILITNKQLFTNENRNEYIYGLDNFTNIFEYNQKIKKIPNDISTLLDNMLKVRHTSRYSIKDVLKNNFIKEYSK